MFNMITPKDTFGAGPSYMSVGTEAKMGRTSAGYDGVMNLGYKELVTTLKTSIIKAVDPSASFGFCSEEATRYVIRVNDILAVIPPLLQEKDKLTIPKALYAAMFSERPPTVRDIDRIMGFFEQVIADNPTEEAQIRILDEVSKKIISVASKPGNVGSEIDSFMAHEQLRSSLRGAEAGK